MTRCCCSDFHQQNQVHAGWGRVCWVKIVGRCTAFGIPGQRPKHLPGLGHRRHRPGSAIPHAHRGPTDRSSGGVTMQIVSPSGRGSCDNLVLGRWASTPATHTASPRLRVTTKQRSRCYTAELKTKPNPPAQNSSPLLGMTDSRRLTRKREAAGRGCVGLSGLSRRFGGTARRCSCQTCGPPA
jgi:hypothetical protein